jgi:hypothetical protein
MRGGAPVAPIMRAGVATVAALLLAACSDDLDGAIDYLRCSGYVGQR